ncbi:MAG TPA: hypothetical protein PKD27_09525 [Tepidiformaceae bacterium]|nr:hypothetical protein [Tepidiformaceae bacterium]
MTSPATALTLEAAELAARLRQGLVSIRTEAGGGAGTAWSAHGVIITNHHVAPGSSVEVTLPE